MMKWHLNSTAFVLFFKVVHNTHFYMTHLLFHPWRSRPDHKRFGCLYPEKQKDIFVSLSTSTLFCVKKLVWFLSFVSIKNPQLQWLYTVMSLYLKRILGLLSARTFQRVIAIGKGKKCASSPDIETARLSCWWPLIPIISSLPKSVCWFTYFNF